MSSVQTSRIAPAAGGGTGEPLRHFAPAPLIGGLASPIRKGGTPQG